MAVFDHVARRNLSEIGQWEMRKTPLVVVRIKPSIKEGKSFQILEYVTKIKNSWKNSANQPTSVEGNGQLRFWFETLHLN